MPLRTTPGARPIGRWTPFGAGRLTRACSTRNPLFGSAESLKTGDATSRLVVEARKEELDGIVRVLEVLSSPTRLDLLHRLATPSFVPDLAKSLGFTRQTLQRHLDELVAVGLVHASPARRGALPATQYVANPSGLFAFKENVKGIAAPDPKLLPALPTLVSEPGPRASGRHGAGLLLVHGDVPGRWFPLQGGPAWVVGRDARDDVPLTYDPFASVRHAMLKREGDVWKLTDLRSTNGTSVNFVPLAPGEATVVRSGDVITVGRSHLVLRDGV